MANVFSRRNALLGWLTWKVAKRQLSRQLAGGLATARRGRGSKFVVAGAALGVIAAAWLQRARRSDEVPR